jgi:hypothetical protein
VRREKRLLARRDLDRVEVVVSAADGAREEREPSVARDVREPSHAAVLGDEAQLSRLDVVDVGVDRGAAPAVRADRERAAVVSPDAEAVVLLSSVGQAARVGPVGPDEIDLLVHASTGREREGETRALGGPRDETDGIVECRDLLGPAATGRHGPDLREPAHVGDEGDRLAVG